MSNLKMDIRFNFECELTSIVGVDCHRTHGTCVACGVRFRHHEFPMPFGGSTYDAEKDDGRSYGYGPLCGDCILSSPQKLAENYRSMANRIKDLRGKKRQAEGMFMLADELETLHTLRDLPGGIIATKIAEAYRELDGPKGEGKAA